MHAVDIVAVCAAVVALVACAAVLARQRYLLRVVGAIPMAIRSGGDRWLYGIARYAGGELRWYRSLGLGTRPSRVLRRGELRVSAHRQPRPEELRSLPAGAVIVDCLVGGTPLVFALGENAFTGFISWVEASSPAG
ncbi:MAG TPA: DUF2550 domain-containing protein [Jatrophihabitantaceae bacterium]|nr:DUF2550 domain-containing protein [Jatrophihabitantaceae bacterium]